MSRLPVKPTGATAGMRPPAAVYAALEMDDEEDVEMSDEIAYQGWYQDLLVSYMASKGILDITDFLAYADQSVKDEQSMLATLANADQPSHDLEDLVAASKATSKKRKRLSASMAVAPADTLTKPSHTMDLS